MKKFLTLDIMMIQLRQNKNINLLSLAFAAVNVTIKIYSICNIWLSFSGFKNEDSLIQEMIWSSDTIFKAFTTYEM